MLYQNIDFIDSKSTHLVLSLVYFLSTPFTFVLLITIALQLYI